MLYLFTIPFTFKDRVDAGLYKPGNYVDTSQSDEEVALLKDIGGLLKDGGSDVTLVPEIQRSRFKKNFWYANTFSEKEKHILI